MLWGPVSYCNKQSSCQESDRIKEGYIYIVTQNDIFTPPMEGGFYVGSDTTFPLPWRENFVGGGGGGGGGDIKFPLCN